MKEIELFISPDGRILHVYDDLTDKHFSDLGLSQIRRAGHVDYSMRRKCWQANLRRCGGPLLFPFATEREAKDAKAAWIQSHLIEIAERKSFWPERRPGRPRKLLPQGEVQKKTENRQKKNSGYNTKRNHRTTARRLVGKIERQADWYRKHGLSATAAKKRAYREEKEQWEKTTRAQNKPAILTIVKEILSRH